MGELIIPNSVKVYIDTPVVIYTIEGHPDYYSLLQPLWLKFQNHEITIVSSELTLMEVLIQPIKNHNETLREDYETILLSSGIDLIPISQSILRDAAYLRAMTNLKTPDAIQATTALVSGCDLLITNDNDFSNLTNISVLLLKEVLSL